MSEIISPEFVFLDVKAQSAQELFAELGGKLFEAGRVKDDYIDALVERESKFPTGLPVQGGVAIPHTDASHVLIDTIAIAVLDNPVSFHEMGGDEDSLVEVSTVFMLALTSANDHLKMLQKIVKNIQQPQFLTDIHAAADESAVANIVSQAFGLDQ